MKKEKRPPNPGSDEAVAKGCSCPVLDNAHGTGYMYAETGDSFWINGDCPLHGTKARPELEPR